MFTDGRDRCPNFVRGGFKEGFVKISPYGAVVSEAARKQADDVKAKLIDGGYRDLQGPAQGQHGQGGHRRPASARGQTDIELEKMDYLVEGVIGATS